MGDDAGYDHLNCFGAKDIHPPNLDRLAAEGTKLSGKLPLSRSALDADGWKSICVGPRYVPGMSAIGREAKIVLLLRDRFCFFFEKKQ